MGGDPPIPSPGSAAAPFPVEYVLKNGNLQLGNGQQVAIPQLTVDLLLRGLL